MGNLESIFLVPKHPYHMNEKHISVLVVNRSSADLHTLGKESRPYINTKQKNIYTITVSSFICIYKKLLEFANYHLVWIKK